MNTYEEKYNQFERFYNGEMGDREAQAFDKRLNEDEELEKAYSDYLKVVKSIRWPKLENQITPEYLRGLYDNAPEVKKDQVQIDTNNNRQRLKKVGLIAVIPILLFLVWWMWPFETSKNITDINELDKIVSSEYRKNQSQNIAQNNLKEHLIYNHRSVLEDILQLNIYLSLRYLNQSDDIRAFSSEDKNEREESLNPRLMHGLQSYYKEQFDSARVILFNYIDQPLARKDIASYFLSDIAIRSEQLDISQAYLGSIKTEDKVLETYTLFTLALLYYIDDAQGKGNAVLTKLEARQDLEGHLQKLLRELKLS